MPFSIAPQLAQLKPQASDYATRFIDLLLQAALQARASDVHLHPWEQQLEVRWRIDGVLYSLGQFPRGTESDIITRLKVLADLLTYRQDSPQEGRLRQPLQNVEMRVSTFPTLHGERAVVRLFATLHTFRLLEEIGLPHDVLTSVQQAVDQASGAVIISGPAGTGKTTTAYAILRSIVHSAATIKSVVTLEDPIESALEGISQSQIQTTSGFTLAAGLRSLLRQDPEVILVGEIRDAETAEGVFQAALTGHLVISTFHAGSTVEGIGRLREMGIESYLLQSGLQALLCQRLLRRLCVCAVTANEDSQRLNLPVKLQSTRVPVGCAACQHTGYVGRLLVVEALARHNNTLHGDLLKLADTRAMQLAAAELGVTSLWERALSAVAQGETSPAEVRRVFGVHYEQSVERGNSRGA
jgi:type II secretory ATPase GspE/PulE/Tfp pilus assembly ATPase PilB-like protein